MRSCDSETPCFLGHSQTSGNVSEVGGNWIPVKRVRTGANPDSKFAKTPSMSIPNFNLPDLSFLDKVFEGNAPILSNGLLSILEWEPLVAHQPMQSVL